MRQLILVVLLPLVLGALQVAAAEKPNIIVFVSDDHGWSDAGCYGNQDVRTPHLDAIAAEGLRFTHAFAVDTICSPSRAVLNTGLMPFRNGGHVFGGHVTKGVRTFSHFLRPLGYETALLGKASLHPGGAFPFDVIERKWKPGAGEAETLPRVVEQFLSNRDETKPLFLEVCTGNPHMPWIENRKYDPARLKLPAHYIDTPETRDAMADYYTSVSTMDQTLGRVREILQKHGYVENTVFIYTSDHGANFPLAKWCLYDAGIRVPLLVRWPGKVPAGATAEAMVSLADVLPTVVEAAGGQPPADLDGRSFLGILRGGNTEHREYVFASHTGYPGNYPDWKANWSPHRAIRTRTHKYVLNLNPNYPFVTHLTGCDPFDPNRQPQATHPFWKSWEKRAKSDERARQVVSRYTLRPLEELYDLTSDPDEQHNLVGDPAHAGLLISLRKRLSDWRATQNDRVPVFLTDYVAPNRNDPVSVANGETKP
jgi:N-sulfoglucosamine sulfohydrolase